MGLDIIGVRFAPHGVGKAMDNYTQERRRLRIDTVLGQDHVLLVSLKGHDSISGYFTYDLELASTDHVIQPDDLLGTLATFQLDASSDLNQTVNGIVSRFASVGRDVRGFSLYRIRIVPSLWLLTRTSDCRVFQNKTVREIVDTVLADYGIQNRECSRKDMNGNDLPVRVRREVPARRLQRHRRLQHQHPDPHAHPGERRQGHRVLHPARRLRPDARRRRLPGLPQDQGGVRPGQGRADAEAARGRASTGRRWRRAGREVGRESTLATVQQFLGIPIDHFAEVNLLGFYDIARSSSRSQVCLNARR